LQQIHAMTALTIVIWVSVFTADRGEAVNNGDLALESVSE
jgi:hypothetical protein